MAQRPKKKPKSRKCPICGRAAAEEFRPFCSKHCAEADLARWLKGAYAVPGAPVSEEPDSDLGRPPSKKLQ